MLDNIDYEESIEVPVLNVSYETLKRVVAWMEKWKTESQPSPEEIKDKLADTIDAWDQDFLKMELTELYDLVKFFALLQAFRFN